MKRESDDMKEPAIKIHAIYCEFHYLHERGGIIKELSFKTIQFPWQNTEENLSSTVKKNFTRLDDVHLQEMKNEKKNSNHKIFPLLLSFFGTEIKKRSFKLALANGWEIESKKKKISKKETK